MKLTQQLKIKQNQSLIMTPQLQQAIKLLQLSNIELAEYVEDAKNENPFLKEDLVSKKIETNSIDKTNEIRMSEKLINDVNINSQLETENTFDSHLDIGGKELQRFNNQNFKDKFTENSSTSEIIEKTKENDLTLQQYLINQIKLEFPNELISFAISMTDYLHPSGWLITPFEEIHRDLNLELDTFNVIIKKLQSLEPSGVFSRNLSECLKIQLIENGDYSDQFEILLGNLELLTSGKFKTLSKLIGVDQRQIIEMVNIIKTLNPKPAEKFLKQNLNISQPDVIISRSEKGWKIDLNRSTLPSVDIDEEYINEMENVKLDEKAETFTSEKIGEAKWLKKAVEQRNKTILRVTSEILKKQTAFFKHGFSHMKPLILKDIADAIGMHESTISRVTNSKLILSDWGLLSMKDFFSASIQSSQESDKHAASAVREALKKLISTEISSKPLSDEKISEYLSNKGMDVARRTVAKYRDMLNIPSSAQRRRNSRFNKLLSNG